MSINDKRFSGFLLSFAGGWVAQAIVFMAIMFRYVTTVDGDYYLYGFIGITLFSLLSGTAGFFLHKRSNGAKLFLGAAIGITIGAIFILFGT